MNVKFFPEREIVAQFPRPNEKEKNPLVSTVRQRISYFLIVESFCLVLNRLFWCNCGLFHFVYEPTIWPEC